MDIASASEELLPLRPHHFISTTPLHTSAPAKCEHLLLALYMPRLCELHDFPILFPLGWPVPSQHLEILASSHVPEAPARPCELGRNRPSRRHATESVKVRMGQ